MATLGNSILQKHTMKYYCEKCDYGTSKKSSYDDHLLSTKHNKSTIINQNLPKICSKYICQNCNKEYKDNSGLWKHKQKCKSKEDSDEPIDKELLMSLIKENMDLKKLILEIVKKDTYNNTNDFEKV